jgi:hypothetical protein
MAMDAAPAFIEQMLSSHVHAELGNEADFLSSEVLSAFSSTKAL